jgi:hypothetical protein
MPLTSRRWTRNIFMTFADLWYKGNSLLLLIRQIFSDNLDVIKPRIKR